MLALGYSPSLAKDCKSIGFLSTFHLQWIEISWSVGGKKGGKGPKFVTYKLWPLSLFWHPKRVTMPTSADWVGRIKGEVKISSLSCGQTAFCAFGAFWGVWVVGGSREWPLPPIEKRPGFLLFFLVKKTLWKISRKEKERNPFMKHTKINIFNITQFMIQRVNIILTSTGAAFYLTLTLGSLDEH